MILCLVTFLLVLRPSASHVLHGFPSNSMDMEDQTTPESLSNHAYEDPDQQIHSQHSDEPSELSNSADHLDPLSVIMEENVLCSWYVLVDQQGTQINAEKIQIPIGEDYLPKPLKSSDSTCLDSAIARFPFISSYQAATDQEKKAFLAETISPYLEAEEDELRVMDADQLVPLFNVVMFNSKALSLPPCFIPANTSAQHRSIIEKLVSEAYLMSQPETSFLQRLNEQALLTLAEQAVEGVSSAKACQGSVSLNCGKCKKCREKCGNSCDICEEKVMKAFLSHTSREKRHDTRNQGSGLTLNWSPLTGLGVGWSPAPLWSSSSNNGDLHVDLMPTPFGVQPVIHKNNMIIPLNNHARAHAWNYGFNPSWNYGFNPRWNYGFTTPRWNYGFNSGYKRKRRSLEQQNYLKVYMQKYFEKLAKEGDGIFASSKRTIPECADCVKCNIGCRDPCLKCQDWKCQQGTT